MNRRTLAKLLLTGVPLAATRRLAAQTPAPNAPSATPAKVIAKEDGPQAINNTIKEGNVYGADLGHTFLYHDKIYMIFGDTFGPDKKDWRSNTGAIITADTNPPRNGLTFDRMITDRPGHAKELLSSKKINGDEITVIPTYGVAVGDRMFLHYMSVQMWGFDGSWTLNYSGLAYSDDGGQNWTKDKTMTWPGDSNFGQVAIVKLGEYAYFFGIPGGRFGGARLARVPQTKLLTKSAYEYWTGSTWAPNDPKAAGLLVPADVGELSVGWNSHYQKWLMMYLDSSAAAIVLRTADCLTGPWSDELTVATNAVYPQLYAPYILPKWNDGPEIYFTMSQFGPYAVYLMQTSLHNIAPSTQAAQCVAP